VVGRFTFSPILSLVDRPPEKEKRRGGDLKERKRTGPGPASSPLFLPFYLVRAAVWRRRGRGERTHLEEEEGKKGMTALFSFSLSLPSLSFIDRPLGRKERKKKKGHRREKRKG